MPPCPVLNTVLSVDLMMVTEELLRVGWGSTNNNNNACELGAKPLLCVSFSQ